jgi:DNA-binding CsgD family transcriptional regulator
MANKSKKNVLVQYGLLMGLLFVTLQAVNYRTVIHDLSMEMYSVIIAILFLSVGLWIGIKISTSLKTKSKEQKATNMHGLSDRELDVVKLMADGLTNQEIADRLYISLNTIKTHISNIYSKLNVARRTQAIQKARELNIF